MRLARLRARATARQLSGRVLALAIGAAFAGCAASGRDTPPNDADSGVPSGSSGSSGGGSSGGATAALLPVRVRRLTNAEWRASTKALIGLESKTALQFTPDARQRMPNPTFAVNDAQLVDPVLAGQLDVAAHEIANAAGSQLSMLAPCGAPASGGEACAAAFIAKFATAAYRRPATQAETSGLLAVYHAAADGGTYAEGVQAVIAAVLQSPGYIYVTEIGNATGAVATLTDYEIASELSFLLTGGPPDAALLAAAGAGQLSDATVRQQHARRLLTSQAAGAQLTQIIEQWLGIDGVAETAKDTTAYPAYAGMRDLMKAEADAFIGEIVWKERKGVSELFGANWTTADPARAGMLANFYGAAAPDATGRVSLAGTGRAGILDQAAFLSVYASATASAPVLRGVAVLRRVACVDVLPPSQFNIVVVPPAPDPAKTTRQLYAVHATDAKCAACHDSIDAMGFAFENFDGEGKRRTIDNGHAVDTTTTVSAIADIAGNYADSAQLVSKLASSSVVRECFARYMFRYAAARSGSNSAKNPNDAAERAAEGAFVAAWNALPADRQDSLVEVLVAYAGTPAFVTRQVMQ